jgi:hypothetical protein
MAESERERLARVGLCTACSQARTIRSAKSSEFWLCERSKRDSRFAKYPRLPVLACVGFEIVRSTSL